MGSAEMWRLRRVDEAVFREVLHQADSPRVARPAAARLQPRRAAGRPGPGLPGGRHRARSGAQLTNARLEPLAAPSVPLQVFGPDGTVQTVVLRADPSRAGTFVGHFTAAPRRHLPPRTADPRKRRPAAHAAGAGRVPDLELENPQRNDALLSRIATQTGGRYYVGHRGGRGRRRPRFDPAVGSRIAPRPSFSPLRPTPSGS